MNDVVQLTISGKKFTLTRAEAEFIAEHLRTAVSQPNLALHFTHSRAISGDQIVLTRGSAADVTDC